MIIANKISCQYQNGENKQILFENQDIVINDGDFVIITGPSGSGKSSLLKILSGMCKPTKGSVLWDNIDIYGLSNKELTNIRLSISGYVYQEFMLIDELNAYDNILLIQNLIKRVNKAKINDIISKLNISDLMKKYPKVLSGGEKQKVAIARALVNNPKIIFCDEPTGSLDFKSTAEIMNFLSILNKEYNITIVLVTHELDNLSYGNKFIKFDNGVLKCE